MTRSILALFVVLFVAQWPQTGWAGAPHPNIRGDFLPHVCAKGSRNGLVCTEGRSCVQDADCNGGTCDFDSGNDIPDNTCVGDCPGGDCVFQFTSKKVYPVTVTAIMDDATTHEGPDGFVITSSALTVMFEVRRGKSHRIIADTYQSCADPSAQSPPCPPVWGGPIYFGSWDPGFETKEANFLQQSLSKTVGLNTMLGQSPNGTMVIALQTFFGEKGTPVIVSTGNKLEETDASDNFLNGACVGPGDPDPCCTGPNAGICSNYVLDASVVRFKAKLRFAGVP